MKVSCCTHTPALQLVHNVQYIYYILVIIKIKIINEFLNSINVCIVYKKIIPITAIGINFLYTIHYTLLYRGIQVNDTYYYMCTKPF